MKFAHLIEYNTRNVFFFINLVENEARRLVPGRFFKKYCRRRK